MTITRMSTRMRKNRNAPTTKGAVALLLLQKEGTMHPTFLQKVLLCMIAGFFAACLIQWAKVFVEGADDALNSGYRKDTVTVVVGH